MPIKQRHNLYTGICVMGAALPLLLSGCGGGSIQKSSFGSYTDAGPAAYGLEGTASNGVLTAPIGGPFFYETSGFQASDASAAYFTAATDFAVVTGAGVLRGVDPAGTGKVPLGFSTNGQYIDANTATATIPDTQSVRPGASVVFRAAISNGLSAASRSVIPILYNGVSLTSSDPEWTLGTLPLTFNFTNSGPFANATYVTGTPVQSGQGTPTAFALPFTTTGLHTVTLTVKDTTGQQTTTNFTTSVLNATDVAVFAQNIVPDNADGTPGTASSAIAPGSTATITGAVGTRAQSTADAQGTIILYAAPGRQTLTVTSPSGTTTTQTLDLTGSAGTTVIVKAL